MLRLLSVTSSSIASRSICRFVRLPWFSSRDKVGLCQFAWPLSDTTGSRYSGCADTQSSDVR
jgi:hypothetical protein